MFNRASVTGLKDFFLPLSKRADRGVYFYRINGYNAHIHEFIEKYYDMSILNGVVIEGKLKNPDINNLSYFDEIIGPDFELNSDFIEKKLTKWLPRLQANPRKSVAMSIEETLLQLKKNGKTDSMIKNAYTKFMCWLYYKFERIANNMGQEEIPKILYEGDISIYELLLMNVLCLAGCDVVLLQYNGDLSYKKTDPDSVVSIEYTEKDMIRFPEGFCLKSIREKRSAKENEKKLYGSMPDFMPCTNAWISGKVFEDLKKSALSRGDDKNLFYNCFFRINGVYDKLTYESDLFKLSKELRAVGRHTVIVDNGLSPPSVEEVGRIKRGYYNDFSALVKALSANLRTITDKNLRDTAVKSFIDVLIEEKGKNGNLNRLMNKAVYLLCFFNRYEKDLFSGLKFPEVACFIYLGGCSNENESLFFKFLSKLPVDVLILCPNLEHKCCLEDKMLYEETYSDSMDLIKFPGEGAIIRVGTTAYHAESELDSMLYQNTGIYRSQQFKKASSLTLKTMYEEIEILWNQDVIYRPEFSSEGNEVNIPVIFSKVNGVKDGNVDDYWYGIKKLITDDTIVISKIPHINPTQANPIKPYVTTFIKNGRFLKDKIKENRNYAYAFLTEEKQEYILSKIKDMIKHRIMKGTGENGAEYGILSTLLNLDKQTVRLIQKFDFTRKNPKIIYIVTEESILSFEDATYAAFMNLLGFDVLLFAPTGYRCVEGHFNNPGYLEQHQIGEYMYDLTIPDFDTFFGSSHVSWRDRFFRGKK